MVRRLVRSLLVALNALWLSAASAQGAGSSSPAKVWSGATVLLQTDHPRIVSMNRGSVTLLAAPFLRGVKDGTSGLLSLDLVTGQTDWLLRSTPEMLPNHLAPVLDDGEHLYWLNGLRIMKTSRRLRETTLLSQKGSIQMDMHGGAIFTYNYNNERKLLRMDTRSGQVDELATLPFVANALRADARSVWLLTRPAPGLVSRVVRFDLATRQSTEVVVAPDGDTQIRALVPYPAPSTLAASSSFEGFYLVERNTRTDRPAVKHYDLRSGRLTTLAIDAIDELAPMYGDASAFYYFARGTRDPFISPSLLYRYSVVDGKSRLLSRGPSPAHSLWVQRGEGETGRVLWTDLRHLYALNW